MLVHQKAHEGNLKLERGLGEHLPNGRDIDDWHWLTSLNQARAIAYGIEHFRSLYPRNQGTIVWQLNDNWPVVSWASVDYAGIRKPLWHSIKRSYADRLLTFQPRADEYGAEVLALIAHNDSATEWAGELVITRRGTGSGTPVLAEQRLPLHLDARSAITVALDADVLATDDPAGEFVAARRDRRTAGDRIRLLRRGHRPPAGRTGGGVRVRRPAGRRRLPGAAGGQGPGQRRDAVRRPSRSVRPCRLGPDHSGGRRLTHLRGARHRSGRGRPDRWARAATVNDLR